MKQMTLYLACGSAKSAAGVRLRPAGVGRIGPFDGVEAPGGVEARRRRGGREARLSGVLQPALPLCNGVLHLRRERVEEDGEGPAGLAWRKGQVRRMNRETARLRRTVL